MSAFLTPSNAHIIPVDTRSTIKSIMLPDVATNPGRFLVFKDTYGNAAVNSIYLSTLSNNFFEQSMCNTYIANQNYGAWTLTNDGISRWIFTDIYSSNLYIYKQTGIVTDGLLLNLNGNTYTSNGFWPDSLGVNTISSGLLAAQPSLGVDAEGMNIPRFNGTNQYFRSFTPMTSNVFTSSFSYNLWFNNTSNNGSLINEAANPSTFVSSLSIGTCSIGSGVLYAGFRAKNGSYIYNTVGTVLNTWNNASWTYSRSTLRLYYNGTLTGTQTNNRDFVKSTFSEFYPTIGLGGASLFLNTNAQYRGMIGSLQLYSTILTPQQVAQNYNADAYRYGRNQLPGF